MLLELEIKNLAILEKARALFGPGLNVVSGETGAGKSLLVDAVEAALGGKVSGEMVRSGEERAWITAVFNELPSSAIGLMAEAGLPQEADGTLTVSREIDARGRSLGRLNGRTVPLSVLRDVTAILVDLHGQHEHQSLLRPERQLDLLDAFEDGLVSAREKVSGLYQALREIELRAGESDEGEMARREEVWNYQLDEISKLKPVPGEDLDLEKRRGVLANQEKLAGLVDKAYGALYGGNQAALDKMSEAVRALEEAANYDQSLTVLCEALGGCREEAKEAARDLGGYRDRLEADPGELERVDDRLNSLRELKRKFGATLEEVLSYKEKAAAELSALAEIREKAGLLREEKSRLNGALEGACAHLSQGRREAAVKLSQGVTEELEALGMAKAVFKVGVGPGPVWRNGADRVEFLLSANAGEALRPLARVASGGELSRVMLAIRTVSSRRVGSGKLPVLVFDEVDAGLGGVAAGRVAGRLRRAAEATQVIAVTHLPQVAAAGEWHFSMEKMQQSGRTISWVRLLEGEERVREVARMLAGGTGDKAMDHARELLSSGA